MSDQVTTYVLTFKSRVPDDSLRRANLNRFLKAALRNYRLDLVDMQTKTVARRARKAKTEPSTRPYAEIIASANQRLNGSK